MDEGSFSRLDPMRQGPEEEEEDRNGRKVGIGHGAGVGVVRRKQWPWTAWQGLYRRLESVIKIEDWGYVPLGDFLGLWWHFKNTKRAGAKWLYLQLEVAPKERSRRKLCFKVEVDKNSSSAEKGTIRDECSKTILDMKDARVERPRRMGVGRHMTVAVWRGDWLGFDEDDLIDINTMAANLSAAEELINDAAKRL